MDPADRTGLSVSHVSTGASDLHPAGLYDSGPWLHIRSSLAQYYRADEEGFESGGVERSLFLGRFL